MAKDQVEFIYYLNVIRKRKWFIGLPVIFLMAAAAVGSLLLPRRWVVMSLIQPARFTAFSSQGRPEEIVVVPSQQIVAQINEGTYNHLIAAELLLDSNNLPRIVAEIVKDTNLIRIIITGKDIERAKMISRVLFRLLKNELDRKSEMQFLFYDDELKRIESKRDSSKNEMVMLRNKLNIIVARERELLRELKDTQSRNILLEKEKNGAQHQNGRSKVDALTLLIYLNEIQDNLKYDYTLKEGLSAKRLEKENLEQIIKDNELNIEVLDLKIKNLSAQKERVEYARVIKEIAVQSKSVSPDIKTNIFLAGVLGLMIFTMVAFFLEYIARFKSHSGSKFE